MKSYKIMNKKKLKKRRSENPRFYEQKKTSFLAPCPLVYRQF
jgi:hypothetical protein